MSFSSISSRYGSLLLAVRLSFVSGCIAGCKKPEVTYMAGFESSLGCGPPEPVVTSMAGFGGALWPLPPGARSAKLADRKYPPAVSRRTPVACSIRRSDHRQAQLPV